ATAGWAPRWRAAPGGADRAPEPPERAAGLWTNAAREAWAASVLAEPARRCVGIAAERVPAPLGPAVADLAELVDSGRCPGDLLADRIAEIGPHATLEELAHA